ncbi:MAG: hypothetical protein JSS12_08040, partial [Verrucomicrobia bacterium]|nr:hypothetical protein [Verrucomicrobiota bacterium]
MSSIATVDRLLASWDQLIGQIDAPPAESILLTCRDGSLQFERKPKKSFQDRILRLM